MRSYRWLTALVVLSLGTISCDGTLGSLPGDPMDDGDDGDDGDVGTPPPPDKCNSQSDAVNVPECQLTLGTEKVEYIGLAGDVDWYSVKLPAGLTSRSLLHVTAGISAPATAVNLEINVLEPNNKSVGVMIDKHGQAAPTALDMIVREDNSGVQLLIMVQDQSGKQFDWRNPYTIKVEVVDDPDVNEPNDTTPTVVPLTGSVPMITGSASGYLATTDDVDEFSLDVPANGQVMYLHVSAPEVAPVANYRMSYTLNDPSGVPVAQGVMTNAFLAVDLATARRSSTGKYVLQLQGYHSQMGQHIPGDLRLKYTVDALVIPELDTHEPNETIDTASATTLGSPGASTTIHGRLGEVPDADWYAFDLPATTSRSTLYWHLTPGQASGRFPVLPGILDRQLRVFTAVDGASVAEKQSKCNSDANTCPRREDADNNMLGTVAAYCNQDVPRCMWAGRQEDVKFGSLRNFEGAIPVPAHTGTVRYYILMEDSENDWADDVEYTLDVQWRTDADESMRWSGSTEQTLSSTISVDGAASGFPVPMSASNDLTGTLSYGSGYWRNNDPLHGEGVRAHDDYDAISSDGDRYELVFPAGLNAPLDQTWELQWEIEKDGSGNAPYDIALDVEFCDGPSGGGGCNSVSRTLGYTGGDLGSWHSAGMQGITFQPVYQLQDMTDKVQVTALAWGCFCIEPRFVQGGHFYVKVVAVDRNGYSDVPYHVKTALTGYPKPYNGGMCPAPTQNSDGSWAPGCKFAE